MSLPAQTLHDFVLNLLTDDAARSAFAADPTAALSGAGLGDVTPQDIGEVVPLVADYAPAPVADALGSLSSLPAGAENLQGAITQLQAVAEAAHSLPIPAEGRSLPVAGDGLPAVGSLPVDLPNTGGLPAGLPDVGSLPVDLPNTGGLPAGLPDAGSLPVDLPNASSLPLDLPKADGLPVGLPDVGSLPVNLPNTGGLPAGLPDAGSLPVDLPNASSLPLDLPKADGLPVAGSLPVDLPNTGGLPAGLPDAGSLPIDLPNAGLPVDLPNAGSLPGVGELPVDQLPLHDLPLNGLPAAGLPQVNTLPVELPGTSSLPIADASRADLPTGDLTSGLPTGDLASGLPADVPELDGLSDLGTLNTGSTTGADGFVGTASYTTDQFTTESGVAASPDHVTVAGVGDSDLATVTGNGTGGVDGFNGGVQSDSQLGSYGLTADGVPGAVHGLDSASDLGDSLDSDVLSKGAPAAGTLAGYVTNGGELVGEHVAEGSSTIGGYLTGVSGAAPAAQPVVAAGEEAGTQISDGAHQVAQQLPQLPATPALPAVPAAPADLPSHLPANLPVHANADLPHALPHLPVANPLPQVTGEVTHVLTDNPVTDAVSHSPLGDATGALDHNPLSEAPGLDSLHNDLPFGH